MSVLCARVLLLMSLKIAQSYTLTQIAELSHAEGVSFHELQLFFTHQGAYT